MKLDENVDSLRQNHDWENIFGEGHIPFTIEACPPGSTVSLEKFTRNDVLAVIACRNGENDSEEWVGVFLLKDGRYLLASGWCDYTGWDCQGGISLEVANTIQGLVAYGLSASQKIRLGWDRDIKLETAIKENCVELYSVLKAIINEEMIYGPIEKKAKALIKLIEESSL